jgi:hypothetical protein
LKKFLSSANLPMFNGPKRLTFQSRNNKRKEFEDITNKYWKASFFDYENEEELLVLENHKVFIKTGAEELLRIRIP